MDKLYIIYIADSLLTVKRQAQWAVDWQRRAFHRQALLHDLVRRSPLVGMQIDRRQKAVPLWLEPCAEYYRQQTME